ncbi:protein-glutamate O-methyltransferase CheR [Caldicellulosiruptoraceae bacterium PP1]
MKKELESIYYREIRRIIENECGIYLSEDKDNHVKMRLNKRMNELSIPDIYHYFNYLKQDKKEIQKLINEITVNETYFFREFDQLKVFGEICLLEIAQEKNQNTRKIRIWSAGCSTGEEPYSLAIIAKEILGDEFEVEILASDIDQNVLNKAKMGIYDKRSVRYLPDEYLNKYFIKVEEGYKINNEIKKMVKFFHHNLIKYDEYSLFNNVDFIFCRNVLIYFSDENKAKVVQGFYNVLNNGGYIFLGHSESVGRLSNLFKLERKDGYIVYRKPHI